MSKKSFHIYLEFNYLGLKIAAFNKSNDELEYYKEALYDTYIDNTKKLNFDELRKFVERNVLELEKTIDTFIKDIYLIIESPQTKSINLSVMKNHEGKKIFKEDALYLIQDAKQQILKSNQNIKILHIIAENYIFDDIEYNLLPLDKNCKKFSINIKFICIPKDLLRSFEKLFSKQQIFISQFLCLNYVKVFNYKNNNKNTCELAKNIVNGANAQEVVLIPKTPKKTGFFAKLFGFFE